MKVLQLNQNKAFTAAVELNKRLTRTDEYICLVTEPFKVKCRVASRPEGSRVLVQKSVTPPRAAIYYKGNFNLTMVENISVIAA